MITRQESLFNWIKDPVNKCNPNWANIIKYWLRLTALILEVEVIDAPLKPKTMIEDVKYSKKYDGEPLLLTTDYLRQIFVVDAIEVTGTEPIEI